MDVKWDIAAHIGELWRASKGPASRAKPHVGKVKARVGVSRQYPDVQKSHVKSRMGVRIQGEPRIS